MNGFRPRRKQGRQEMAPRPSLTGHKQPAIILVTTAAVLGISTLAAVPALSAQAAPSGSAAVQPWLNRDQSPTQRASELLAQMTLAQKLQMVDGTGYAFNAGYAGHLQGIPSLGIPDLYLGDGAVGVANASTGVTEFPDGTNEAATWDPATVQAVGQAIGTEQAAK